MSKDVEVRQENGAVAVPAAVLGDGVGEVWTSFTSNDPKTKALVFNALAMPEKVVDILNKTIWLKNVAIQNIEIANEETGEVSFVHNVILFDEQNKAYSACSEGVYGAINRLFGLYGHPSTWLDPLPVKIVEQRGKGARRFYSLLVDIESATPKK